VKFKGKDSAKIALVEYSDVECPFCQRHFSSKTVETVITKHADLVKSTFKHFPLSFHPTAQKAAEGIECAGKQGKYLEFETALFEASIADAGKKPTKEVILAAAKKLSLKEADFSKCLDSGETADKVKSDMNEGGSLFGVTGTPGNVLINTETGKYVVIAGAYPADQFDAVVAELSK
jgi:protein-disulfide isomerase